MRYFEVMETRLNFFNRQIVSLPGGKDIDGHPIVLITIPAESPPQTIISSLQYLLSIFSNESRNLGVTVLLDTRKGPWKTARSYIRQISNCLTSNELYKLIVIKSDAFWDKQRMENCTSSPKCEQLIFTPASRLNKFVEQSQLPQELGGCYIYNHKQWIENRLNTETFFEKTQEILRHSDIFYQYIVNNHRTESEISINFKDANWEVNDVQSSFKKSIETGNDLLRKIEKDNRNRKLASESDAMTTPQDITDTIKKIDEVLSTLRLKQNDLEKLLISTMQSIGETQDYQMIKHGIITVTNWILGPGENMLNYQNKVGFDVISAEELRNEHEVVELQCCDTYGSYAELLHKINNFLQTDILPNQRKDIVCQRDFMDFVCRSYATRLERRRNILITSLRFFRLVSEYFDKTGAVFDSLVMDNNAKDLKTAKRKLQTLQESQQILDFIESKVAKEGEKLADMLSMPVKDALGRELALDYSEDIVNIKDILEATTARKNIFSDSVELQKLTLDQISHINTYEKDVLQAINWLNDLFKVMLKYHSHVGITVYEIHYQRREQETFQSTAKSTFNYGCQLLSASLLLRQSCKLPLEDNSILSKKLQLSWNRLLEVSQEQMTRLRVSAIFHRSVEDHCTRLRDLREAIARMPLEEISKKQIRVRNFCISRELLLVEVGRTVRLGKLLRSRLKEPIFVTSRFSDIENFKQGECTSDIKDLSVIDNVYATEAINEKLIEITTLAEELDQALESAQQDCGFFVENSSTSTTPTTIINMTTRKDENELPFEENSFQKPSKPEEFKSDDEFLTASDCTLQHSRSSSYNTASECEHRYSPWWDHDKKNSDEKISSEKMVLGVGLPDLPEYKTVSTTIQVPPGKIVREVVETTHLNVQHSHKMGIVSYVLTSEIAKESTSIADNGAESSDVVAANKNFQDNWFLKEMKEVGKSSEDETWKANSLATIKGCL